MTQYASHPDTAQPVRVAGAPKSQRATGPATVPPDHPVMVLLNHRRSAGLWELAVIHALHTATRVELLTLADHYLEHMTVQSGRFTSVNKLMNSLGLSPVNLEDLDLEELRLDLIEAITANRQERVESVRERLASIPMTPAGKRFLDRMIESSVLIAALVLAILDPGSRPRRKWQRIPDNHRLLYILTCAVLTAAPPVLDTTGAECSPCA